MQAKKSLVVGSFLVLSSAAIAAVRPAPAAEEKSSATAEKGRAEVVERAYELSKFQAEALAALLRLDMPRDTAVKTDLKNGSRIIISGPKAVHDAVAPLIVLFANERAARTGEQAAKTKADLIEMEKNFRAAEAALEAKRLERRQREQGRRAAP